MAWVVVIVDGLEADPGDPLKPGCQRGDRSAIVAVVAAVNGFVNAQKWASLW
jgi:hypothetical protein